MALNQCTVLTTFYVRWLTRFKPHCCHHNFPLSYWIVSWYFPSFEAGNLRRNFQLQMTRIICVWQKKTFSKSNKLPQHALSISVTSFVYTQINNAVLMSAHRLRRWSKIEPTLVQGHVTSSLTIYGSSRTRGIYVLFDKQWTHTSNTMICATN